MNRQKRNASSSQLLIEVLESRQLLSSSADVIVSPSLILNAAASSSGSVEGYTPAQIKAAYGISSINFTGVTGTGAGQTIAIIDAYSDPNIVSDLSVFDKQFSLAAPASFTQESATGSTTKLPAENADWDSEISLDVEWAHAIAPKANIILVDASSDSMSGLMSAVKFARTISSVSVISMSWGGSEFSGETAYDSDFTTPSGHIGITFVAASGDDGAAGGADYPAASPNVVSVGGTTLSLSSTGTVESETAWSDSEGGVSQFESTPSYQSGVSTSGRSTPDVSYDADPNTGFAVYDSVADDGSVGWQEVGGTSAGTPQWSALIAIADQGRAKNGLSTLTSTQTLTELYGIYANPADYAADFTDITSGSSGGGGFGGFGGPFGGRGRFHNAGVSATVGYDTLTGLGTPKATSLVETLASAKVNSSAVVKTTTATAAKVVKTKAAAAIEVQQLASVFGIAGSGPSQLLPIQPVQTDIEIEATAASTAAATVANSKTGATDAAGFARPTFPSENQISAEAVQTDASAMTTILADASASPSVLAASAATEVANVDTEISQAAARVSAFPGVLGETTVARDFRDALGEFVQDSSVPPTTARHEQQQSSSANLFIEGLAVTADAVLIGYYYSKKKRNVGGGNVFNDQRMI
jgi:hypothetical protein